MTADTIDPTILLIPGHWLGAWAWHDVQQHLTALGRRPVPLTLPGLDPFDAHVLGDCQDTLTKWLNGS